MMTRKDVEQALARGYCTPRNGTKVLDPDLIEDMATEVLKLRGVLTGRPEANAETVQEAAERGFYGSEGKPSQGKDRGADAPPAAGT